MVNLPGHHILLLVSLVTPRWSVEDNIYKKKNLKQWKLAVLQSIEIQTILISGDRQIYEISYTLATFLQQKLD